jgi:sec-independent protein translocase protein TatA
MARLLFIGGLGPPELLLIAGVLILLFGASKLPKLARSMGSATGEFKKGRQEVEEELGDIQEGEPEGTEADSDSEIETDVETDRDVETDPNADSDSEIETEQDPEQTGI